MKVDLYHTNKDLTHIANFKNFAIGIKDLLKRYLPITLMIFC